MPPFAFLFTIGAALFWGLGNTITKWSVERNIHSAFDFSFLKYIVAATFLFFISFILHPKNGQRFSSFLKNIEAQSFFPAAFVKGLNIYFWIVAVTFANAGLIATLENMHVIWTAIFLSILYSVALPIKLAVSSIIILCGVFLISNIGSGTHNFSLLSVVLGIGAGISFSLFVLIWGNKKSKNRELWSRTAEMALLLFVGGVLIFPVHIVVNAVWLDGPLIPFQSTQIVDIGVQALNGLIGIGLTYFLINEALEHLKTSGKFKSLLVGLSLSFAVPITMFSELLLLDVPIVSHQWVGVILFIAGYSVIRANLFGSKFN